MTRREDITAADIKVATGKVDGALEETAQTITTVEGVMNTTVEEGMTTTVEIGIATTGMTTMMETGITTTVIESGRSE
jgi:hypothetical protein